MGRKYNNIMYLQLRVYNLAYLHWVVELSTLNYFKEVCFDKLGSIRFYLLGPQNPLKMEQYVSQCSSWVSIVAISSIRSYFAVTGQILIHVYTYFRIRTLKSFIFNTAILKELKGNISFGNKHPVAKKEERSRDVLFIILTLCILIKTSLTHQTRACRPFFPGEEKDHLSEGSCFMTLEPCFKSPSTI